MYRLVLVLVIFILCGSIDDVDENVNASVWILVEAMMKIGINPEKDNDRLVNSFLVVLEKFIVGSNYFLYDQK